MWSALTDLTVLFSLLAVLPCLFVVLAVLFASPATPTIHGTRTMSSPAHAAKARHAHPMKEGPSDTTTATPASTPSSHISDVVEPTTTSTPGRSSRGDQHGGASSTAMAVDAKGSASGSGGSGGGTGSGKTTKHDRGHERESQGEKMEPFASEPRQTSEPSHRTEATHEDDEHVGVISISPEHKDQVMAEPPHAPSVTDTATLLAATSSSSPSSAPSTAPAVLAPSSAATIPMATTLATSATDMPPHPAESMAVIATTLLPPQEAAKYATADQLFSTLARIRAEVFAIEGEPTQVPIWVCSRDDKVIDVIQGLIRRKVHAVPVLYRSTGRYMGFLDWMDVLHYVLGHFGRTKFEVERSFWDLVEEEKEFSQKTVNDLMQQHAPVTLRNAFHPINAGYSAFSVVEAMARETSLHRVPILSNSVDRHLINLVTQSQCVRWLWTNRALLGNKLKKPIPACTHFFKPVISVQEDSLAIDAFQLMATRRVQGLAIIDAAGRLRGNISVRDLKIIGADAALFWRLTQTVKNFMRKVHMDYRMSQGRPRSVVFLVPTDSTGKHATLEDVMATLVKHSIHRIYLCDTMAARRPIGVVSLRDILIECIA